MRVQLIIGCLLLGSSALGTAQEIVKVPAGKVPSVSRPDDLFKLAPGQWHFARRLWEVVQKTVKNGEKL